jgi:uncharacterized membrane protein (GlpM family)
VLLALKLVLVPAFLAVISFAGKRWGPNVAGWLAGFPSLTGPILAFLAYERGAEFTVQAAVLSLAAVVPAISFGVAYAWSCARLPWPGALACAMAAWMSAALLLAQLPLSVPLSLGLSLATLFVAPRLFPRPRGQWSSRALPAQELLLRMGAGAAMVLGVTAAAEALGSTWTGLFAAFPVMSIVLAVFSHRANGAGFTATLLRSMVAGFYAYLTYCLAMALALPAMDAGWAITTAVLAAVLVQGAAKLIMMRFAR